MVKGAGVTDDAGGRPGAGPGLRTPLFLAGLAFVTAVVIVLDVSTGTAVRLYPLLIFLPAIVSGLGAVWQTAVAAVWVLVVEVGTAIYLRGEPDDILLAAGFTGLFGLLSVAGCRYRVKREAEVFRLRSATSALRQLLVRPLPLRTAEIAVEGLYQPVEEDTMMGGDMYDVAVAQTGTRVLIADVQGKGLSAIGMVVALLGSFREAAHREETLTGVVAALENSVVRHNYFAAQDGEPERLVTALILDIKDASQTEAVEVVNCGHIAPYVIQGRDIRQADLGQAEVPLGLAALAPAPRAGVSFRFARGASLLLCTDGVTEARDARGRFYPLEERLRAWAADPPASLVRALGEDLHAFRAAGQHDDTTILMLRRTGPP